MPYAVGNLKVCSACRSEKHTKFFNRNKSSKDGYNNQCAECARASNVKWAAKHHSSFDAYKANWHRKYRYGVTEDDFKGMLARSCGRCYVCGEPPKDMRDLHIDHDHISGAVRGLLCRSCNSAVGYAKDSPVVLRRLAEYVENPR